MTLIPKVSIVIPVYNGANYIREAVDSALAQTYGNCEVIVINDGSRDDGETDRSAKSYGDAIRYFQKENGGVASALNYGIKAMTGSYFSWLSHDDVYFPNKIEDQIAYLVGKDPLTCVYSDYDVIDEHSGLIRKNRIPHIPPSQLPFELILSFPVNGCTTLIPKKCFEISGMFNESRRYTQDNELWYRLSVRFPFEHVPSILLHSRVHAQAGSYVDSPAFISESNELYIELLKGLMKDRLAEKREQDVAKFLLSAATNLREPKRLAEAATYAWSLYRSASDHTPALSRIGRRPAELHFTLLNFVFYRWLILKYKHARRKLTMNFVAAYQFIRRHDKTGTYSAAGQ